MKPMNTKFWIPLASFLAILLPLAAAMGQGNGNGNGGGGGGGGGGEPSYEIVKLDSNDDLGQVLSGSAWDVNSSRFAVGYVGNNPRAAACWTVASTNGKFESELHVLDFGFFVNTEAFGCNEMGEIVGWGEDLNSGLASAVFWSAKEATLEMLPSPLFFGTASAINDSSIICGWSGDPPAPSARFEAIVWFWQAGEWKYLELPSQGDPGLDGDGDPLPNQSFATDISNVNPQTGLITVVGHSNGNAVRWTVYVDNAGAMQFDSATILATGEAHAVNDSGLVGGWTLIPPSNAGQGVIWSNDDSMTQLQQTYRGRPASPTNVFANDVNGADLIVGDDGWDAIYWVNKESEPVRLNQFLPKRHSVFASLDSANAVNELGDIVGQGWLGEGAPSPPFIAIKK